MLRTTRYKGQRVSIMADRIKARLDKDWHTLLDNLNESYEAAYQSLKDYGVNLDKVARVTLEAVQWPVDDHIHILLGVRMRVEDETDDE